MTSFIIEKVNQILIHHFIASFHLQVQIFVKVARIKLYISKAITLFIKYATKPISEGL